MCFSADSQHSCEYKLCVSPTCSFKRQTSYMGHRKNDEKNDVLSLKNYMFCNFVDTIYTTDIDKDIVNQKVNNLVISVSDNFLVASYIFLL
jgi:hypothetical protein